MANHDAPEDEGHLDESNLGYLTRTEKIKDYALLFVLTFILTRYLTPTAIAVMFFSVFGFHLLHNLTYHEEPRPGFNALHVKYFLGTYLLCILYLQLRRMWKGGDFVRVARLQGYSRATSAAPRMGSGSGAGGRMAGSGRLRSGAAGGVASGAQGGAQGGGQVVMVKGGGGRSGGSAPGSVVVNETEERLKVHEVKRTRSV